MSIEPRGAGKKSGVAIASMALAMIAGSTAAVAQTEVTPAAVSMEALKAEGASVYRHRCAKCHGHAGEGQQHSHDAAPRLSGSFARLSVRTIAVQVIRGGAYMPPFYSLTNREIAAVATYIRNSFGNSYGIATEDEVAENRSELQ
jgi:mono/diheme cytochrome c family protein